MIRSQCFAMLLACATVCVAQTPTAPAPEPASAAAAAVTLSMPQMTCVKPDIPMQRADPRTVERFNKNYKTYADCVKKYVADNQALVEKIVANGKVAIEEYNAFNEELKSRQEAAK